MTIACCGDCFTDVKRHLCLAWSVVFVDRLLNFGIFLFCLPTWPHFIFVKCGHFFGVARPYRAQSTPKPAQMRASRARLDALFGHSVGFGACFFSRFWAMAIKFSVFNKLRMLSFGIGFFLSFCASSVVIEKQFIGGI
ncbi:hypothetical protein TMES_06245 [Thalassospira mesophila]|uniref:Transmembrane protein n=1 Tax=Thalassospira mesophila TaxID=1293891 RepID=A0A1Y2L288_9PROT|nr:hypothetical protein TMES_06245 [Thalassospira mesophila]